MHTFKLIDYTRVSDDAAVLCWRQDFPRAVRLLGLRAPDHRRWRRAFRGVANSAVRTLSGAPRRWMADAVRDLVENAVSRPWLRCELALDLHGLAEFQSPGVLPEWTARDLWSLADAEGLPMEYVVSVSRLPRRLDDLIDTAQTVLDCRRTAGAHRAEVIQLQTRSSADLLSTAETEIDAQRDAAERWRALGQRLLLVSPRSQGLAAL